MIPLYESHFAIGIIDRQIDNGTLLPTIVAVIDRKNGHWDRCQDQ
jgi:hypothetical protein